MNVREIPRVSKLVILARACFSLVLAKMLALKALRTDKACRLYEIYSANPI